MTLLYAALSVVLALFAAGLLYAELWVPGLLLAAGSGWAYFAAVRSDLKGSR